MNRQSKICLALGATLTLGAGAVPLLAAAQSAPTAFLVTEISESAAGRSVIHEALSLEHAASGLRLQLASADGSTFSQPITLNSHGEIASNSQDAAVTCYNMAKNALASQDRSAGSNRAVVFVRFGNSVVTIPLALSATQTQGEARRMIFGGATDGMLTNGATAVKAGIVINAVVDATGDNLRGASFDEVHYLGSPAHVIAHSTCILSHAEPTATART